MNFIIEFYPNAVHRHTLREYEYGKAFIKGHMVNTPHPVCNTPPPFSPTSPLILSYILQIYKYISSKKHEARLFLLVGSRIHLQGKALENNLFFVPPQNRHSEKFKNINVYSAHHIKLCQRTFGEHVRIS